MKKGLLFLSVLLILASDLYAEPWEKTLTFDLKLTQTAYSDSWTGGEAGNVSWVSTLNGIFMKQVTETFNNRTTLKLAFGQTHVQDAETKEWEKPEKSTDQIDIENLSRLTFGGYIDPYFAVRLETQFLDASVDSINRYFSPMLLTESVGGSRMFYKKDKNQILSRLGFAVKHTINKVIVDTAVSETDWNTRTDAGFESVTDVVYDFSESLGYIGKLTIYKALLFSEKDEVEGTPEEDYWKAVDVNWENTISASVAKYVTVSLYVQFLYDKQIEKKGRFKETLGLGLTYKMF
ncbi:MAG: DUF3078 domain-containing protein [candidate division Zixibacteria bacterium]|nr:DUF3078 domain-containing protein [candidate division Zixibacteria bacterium]NIR64009.1 DUF3078 domain-containing protein [candidate division Zixibacteria bacterium]NIS15293.1 DUF3078 domain-containing protein [candidate division Zixibacteria bacterium]NIS45923.1 DUF3078 domain-containing protein [candidate division Zixibacteria bacterium]NIT51820.1 DUF3078 domain-containing protein [candidate division Zixibacteria bacterium]